MNDNRVTYFLGAGASYESMPIISEFNILIDVFRNLIQDENKSPLFNLQNKVNIIHHLNEMQKHPTVDTYAKKIFLIHKYGDEYNLVKEIITILLLTFELFPIIKDRKILNKLFIKQKIIKNKITDGYLDDSKFKNRLLNIRDKRYDGLFSYIFHFDNSDKIGENYIKDNISIISWNYDMQIENTFNTYQALPNQILFNKGHGLSLHRNKNFNSNIKINGSANYYDDKENKYLYDYNSEISENEYLNFITTRLEENTEDINRKESIRNLLNFAWENYNDLNFIKSANTILRKTNILVIIGYSFPAFNREIDKFIFSETEFKTIYLQTEKKNEGLKSRIASLTNNIYEKDIILIDDLEQFYIPFSI